jgi:hypothetical protein
LPIADRNAPGIATLGCATAKLGSRECFWQSAIDNQQSAMYGRLK